MPNLPITDYYFTLQSNRNLPQNVKNTNRSVSGSANFISNYRLFCFARPLYKLEQSILF